jgi:hypothetical protein
MSDEVHVGVAHLLSDTFQVGARICAHRALGIEERYDSPGGAGVDVSNEHRSSVMLSIISSVAFLESIVNELLGLNHDRLVEVLKPDSNTASWNPAPEAALKMATWWADGGARASTADKYSALYLCCSREFDAGANPAQAAFDVIELRDSLIHYRPHWNSQNGTLHRLEQRLRSRKLARNPLVLGDTWPLSYLSAATAFWALDATTALAAGARAVHNDALSAGR